MKKLAFFIGYLFLWDALLILKCGLSVDFGSVLVCFVVPNLFAGGLFYFEEVRYSGCRLCIVLILLFLGFVFGLISNIAFYPEMFTSQLLKYVLMFVLYVHTVGRESHPDRRRRRSARIPRRSARSPARRGRCRRC